MGTVFHRDEYVSTRFIKVLCTSEGLVIFRKESHEKIWRRHDTLRDHNLAVNLQRILRKARRADAEQRGLLSQIAQLQAENIRLRHSQP